MTAQELSASNVLSRLSHEDAAVAQTATEAADSSLPDDVPEEPGAEPVTTYINRHFPSLDTLDQLETHLDELRTKLRALDAELVHAVRHQLHVRRQGAAVIKHAQERSKLLDAALAEVERSMRSAAETLTESAEQFRPIANVRHNLLQARAHLKAFVRLAKALRDMESTMAAQDMTETAEHVRQAREALAELQTLPAIPLLDELQQRYRSLEQHLSRMVVALFGETSDTSQRAEYRAGCILADALENGTREAVLNAFVVRRVRLYEEVFGARDSDLTPIETFERSFAWIRRELRSLDEHWSAVFPESWRVPMALSGALSDALRRIAHRDLEEGKVDVAQLLRALQITLEFEAEMVRRLNTPLTWNLSSVFEPYMGAYVTLENQRLREAIDGALEKETWLVPALGQRAAAAAAAAAPEYPDESIVLPSAKTLFIEIKRCMKRCGVLTTSQTYFNLHKAFKKHLRDYASAMERELLRIRSTATTTTTTTTTTTSNSSTSTNSNSKSTTSTAAVSADAGITEAQEQVLTSVCSLSLTAEYCARTTEQLAETIRQAVDAAFTDSIRMNEERDEFRAIAGRAGKVLVALTCAWALEPALHTLQAQRWSQVAAVGDVSPAVTALVTKLERVSRHVGRQLLPLFFRFYLDKLSGSVLERFTETLFRCKPLSDAAAQQLLLDTQFLKEGLLKLIDCRSPSVERDDPWFSSYQRYVRSECGRAETMLKVRLASDDSAVDAFEALMPEAEPSALRQILEWKGLPPLEAARQVVQYAERTGDPVLVHKARSEMEHLDTSGHRAANLQRQSKALFERSTTTSALVVDNAMAGRSVPPGSFSDTSTSLRGDASKPSTEVRAFLNRLGERLREVRLGDKLESTLDAVGRSRDRRRRSNS